MLELVGQPLLAVPPLVALVAVTLDENPLIRVVPVLRDGLCWQEESRGVRGFAVTQYRLDGSGGSFIPFPRNEDERLTDKDPRISIKERYPSRKIYRESYATAAHALAEKGFLLNMDINPMIDRAERLYDQIMTHNPANETCF